MPGRVPGRVYVLGNCMVDVRLELPHWPRPGETLVGGDGRRSPGGKAVNQAVAAARAGARVRLCTPLGNDPAADEVRHALNREGLEELDAPCFPFGNDFALLLVVPGGENATVVTVNCARALPPDHAARFATAARPGDVLLLQGNLSQAATLAAIRAAPPGAAVFNPSPLAWDAAPVLATSGAVVANEVEAHLLTGEPDPARAALALLARGPALALVTAGAHGCFTAQCGAVRHWPTTAVAALDTSGCGDVFCGVFAAGLAEDHPLERTVMRAQKAAALAAARPGAFASIPHRHEMPP